VITRQPTPLLRTPTPTTSPTLSVNDDYNNEQDGAETTNNIDVTPVPPTDRPTPSPVEEKEPLPPQEKTDSVVDPATTDQGTGGGDAGAEEESSSNSSSSSSSTVGAIVGSLTGVALLGLLGIVVLVLIRQRRRNKSHQDAASGTSVSDNNKSRDSPQLTSPHTRDDDDVSSLGYPTVFGGFSTNDERTASVDGALRDSWYVQQQLQQFGTAPLDTTHFQQQIQQIGTASPPPDTTYFQTQQGAPPNIANNSVGLSSQHKCRN